MELPGQGPSGPVHSLSAFLCLFWVYLCPCLSLSTSLKYPRISLFYSSFSFLTFPLMVQNGYPRPCNVTYFQERGTGLA